MAIHTPLKAWYCMVQIADLRVQKSPYTQTDWFRALVASIEADGLVSPIIVDNRPQDGSKIGGMRPAVGMNRTRVMRELGWTECPAIVYGELPEGTENAVLTPTLGEINNYLRDGEAYQTHDGGFLVRGYMSPESMVYPTDGAPYYGG